MIRSHTIFSLVIGFGLVGSFFNRTDFVGTPFEFYSSVAYKIIYVLSLLLTFVFLFRRKALFYQRGYRRLVVVLFLCFSSWIYGVSTGLIVGNPVVDVFSNYLFLALSLLPLVIIRSPAQSIADFLAVVVPLSFYASLLYLTHSIVAIPTFISSVSNVLSLDFNRSSFIYTYISTAPFFCLLALLCFLRLFHSLAFSKLEFFIRGMSNVRSKFFTVPWTLISRYPHLFFGWFLWLGLFAYLSSAYLIFTILVLVGYISLRYKVLIPLFVFLAFLVFSDFQALFDARFGLTRMNQINEVLQLISFQGNGLGSYVAGRGTPYGTELLFLGIVAQLGLFALPFYLLLLLCIIDLFTLWIKGNAFGFLLSIGFFFYTSSMFTNPSLGAPWAFLLMVTGAFVARTFVLAPNWYKSSSFVVD